jgi:uncharacterized membrane protein
MTSDLRFKTRLFTAIVVLTNVAGNALMSYGVRRHGALGSSVLEYLRVMFNPWVAAGICLLIVWMAARLALLSWADMSFVIPVTSLAYVLAAVAGRVFLGEQVSARRWLGSVLIMAGTALVGSTAVRTHAEEDAPRLVEAAP